MNMARSFERRLQQAGNIQAGALSTFDKAIEELELSARLYRETYDDIQAQIETLNEQAEGAQTNGMRASRRASKLREFLS